MSAISEVKTVHDEGVRNMLLVSPALRATTVISELGNVALGFIRRGAINEESRRHILRRQSKHALPSGDEACFQSSHEISLFWQYALLLPRCVRSHSSPGSSIGVPCEKNTVASKPRSTRARVSLISGSSLPVPRRPSWPNSSRRGRRDCFRRLPRYAVAHSSRCQ